MRWIIERNFLSNGPNFSSTKAVAPFSLLLVSFLFGTGVLRSYGHRHCKVQDCPWQLSFIRPEPRRFALDIRHLDVADILHRPQLNRRPFIDQRDSSSSRYDP